MPAFLKQPSCKREVVRFSNCWNRPKPARQNRAGNGRWTRRENPEKRGGMAQGETKAMSFHRPKRRSPRLVSLPGQRPISSQAPSPHFAEWGRFNDCKEIPAGFLGNPDGNPIPPPVRDSLNCGESPQSCIQGLPDLEYSHSHSIKSSTTCIRSYCTQTAYVRNHR